MPEVETELVRRLARGEELVQATVVRIDGEPPSRPGAKALFGPGVAIAGTLGCSEFDAAALADAAPLLAGATPAIRTYHHDLGSIEVYLEPYLRSPVLVVLAATPVAAALLRWAPEVGFRTVLVETRVERLAAGEWPATATVTSLDRLRDPLGDEVYAVHTDHDAPDLPAALELILDREPRFVGLMGSRRHTGHHLEALRAKGMSEQRLAAIQTPVGIDIGAQTPEEIALSILAGMVAVRRGASANWMDSA